jgi:D-aspartate ligase
MVATNTREVVVVLASGLNGLGVIRSLSVAGIDSVVIAPSRTDPSFCSRLPAQKHLVPKSPRWTDDMMHCLGDLQVPGRPPIIACSDISAKFLVEQRAHLESKFSVLAPDERLTHALVDKRLELELVSQCGIDVPKSATRMEELDPNTDYESFRFPLIIKPRSRATAIIDEKNLIVTNRRELTAFYGKYGQDVDKFVLQEVIPGGDKALWLCSAVFDRDSNMVSAFSYQRLGAMPAHCGVTSIGISVRNAALIDICARVGKSLGYVGPADLEFIRDERTGALLYVEINPRIGMHNWFDTRCGVNTVEMAALIAMNRPITPAFAYRTGIIYWNVVGDLIARLDARQSRLSILRLYTTLLFMKKVWPVYWLFDPYPAIVGLPAIFNGLARRTWRAIGASASRVWGYVGLLLCC